MEDDKYFLNNKIARMHQEIESWMDKSFDMEFDIKKMLVLIASFTKKNTEGEELLKEWQKKYLHQKGSAFNEIKKV